MSASDHQREAGLVVWNANSKESGSLEDWSSCCDAQFRGDKFAQDAGKGPSKGKKTTSEAV